MSTTDPLKDGANLIAERECLDAVLCSRFQAAEGSLSEESSVQNSPINIPKNSVLDNVYFSGATASGKEALKRLAVIDKKASASAVKH